MSSVSYNALVDFVVLMSVFARFAMTHISEDTLVDVKIKLAYMLLPFARFSFFFIKYEIIKVFAISKNIKFRLVKAIYKIGWQLFLCLLVYQ